VAGDNVETVRRAFEAFDTRDIEALLALSDPDCEWLPFRAQLEGSVYRGHEGVRRFVADMDEDWSEFRIDPDEIRDLGDRVLVIGVVHALARGSGVRVENLAGFVLDVRDGRVARLVSYSDPGAARRDAGV
jgi:ketosteroid isomerase-like protein